MKKLHNKGFTLIEILIVMGIIALLAAIVLIAINPARQFAQARNTQRQSDVNEILNAIGQRIAYNRGIFRLPNDGTCEGDIGTSTALRMASSTTSTTDDFDMASCLTPAYLPAMPIDPDVKRAHFFANNDYDSGYLVIKNATTSRITVSAPFAELGEVISATR